MHTPEEYARSIKDRIITEPIQYLAQRHGIIVIEQEESYTSKASFLDLDSIPVYQKGVTLKPVFLATGRGAATTFGRERRDG